MKSGQRLSERIQYHGGSEQDQMSWQAFVRDHKTHIRNLSPKRSFVPEELVKYRYRPWDFVRDLCYCPVKYTWIFMLVNDIRDQADFNESCKKLHMIDLGVIDALYAVWSTSANNTDRY